jgi:hypothetical protein
MILKGSQRANGADLAVHLMNSFDNERVEIAQVYGTVADDLMGAFAEFEAVAQGTKAEKYLYSLSINPPDELTREQYFEAIEAIENRLGLSGQPRAVVFHVKADKHGVPREHCHVVWSRIDVENMKAIHLAHDKRKLMDMACELAHQYGLDLPPGLKAWEGRQRHEKDALEPTLAEKAQQDQTGITPDQRRAEITSCYEQADTAQAFINALEQKGYVLARGDRRGFVVVDKFADVHSLTRYIKGHKAKDISARLAPLKPEDLPTVDQAKEIVRRRKQAREEGEGERRRQDSDQRCRKAEEALAAGHAERRAELLQKEQELLTRQQEEKLSLHAAQAREAGGLLFRMRSAVADLIGRAPGLRSVLGHIQKLTHLDPKERHQLEHDALARRHAREKLDIARQKRMQARVETREIQALQKALRRKAHQARKLDNKAQQDFYDAARDQGLWRKREFKEGDLSVEFNDAAEFVEGVDRAGEAEEEDHAPDWKHRADDLAKSHRPKHGHKPKRPKGFGHRRDDE